MKHEAMEPHGYEGKLIVKKNLLPQKKNPTAKKRFYACTYLTVAITL
jgi:hypothetical protein